MKRFFALFMALILLLATTMPAVALGEETEDDGEYGVIKLVATDKNGNPVPGAEYTIHEDSFSPAIASLITGADGTAISGKLPIDGIAHTFTLKETATPRGYHQHFVNPSVIIWNTYPAINEVRVEYIPITGVFKIVKSDENGFPFPGVTYNIFKETTLIESITTDSYGIATSMELPFSSYIIVEETPEGYESIEPIIRDDELFAGDEIQIGSHLIRGTASIDVKDTGGNSLSGAELSVYTSDNIWVADAATDGYGKAIFTGLNRGNYYAVVKTVPDGYIEDMTQYPFSIEYTNHAETLVIGLDRIIGSVRILKTNGGGTPIPGVTFDLYNSTDQKLSELITDEDGMAVSGGLFKGDYYLLETEAAAGYAPIEEPIPFSITTHNEIVEKTIVNSLGSAMLRVIASGEATPLSGAVFQIFRSSDDGLAGEITTGADGKAETILPLGSYYLIQTQTETGYKLPEGSFPFFLAQHGSINEVTVQNEWIPPQTGFIRAVKLMEGTGILLKGAVFGVYDTNTNALVDTLTTGDDGTALSVELSAGAYYLRELTAPQGFIPITARIDVTVTTGATSDVYIYNTPIPATGRIRLIKLEEGTDKPLPNVVFGIYDAAGHTKVAELTTGTDGTAISGELTVGVYYLVELQGLDGYIVTTEKTGITVEAGETAEITVYNAPLPPPLPTTGYIHLSKKAEGTSIPLGDAVFGVYTVSGDIKTCELTTDADGNATSGELLAGDYYLLEQQAPDGYEPITDRIAVTVIAGETANLTVYNTPIVIAPTTGYIRVVNRAADTGDLLSGTVYSIHDAVQDTKIEEITTGEDGTATSSPLPVGAYYLMERQAAAGHIANVDPIHFYLQAGEEKEMTLINTPEEIPETASSYVRLVKLAEGTGAALPDAIFGLYRQGSDEKIAELITGADGTAISAAILSGDYYLLELTAPTGFKLNPETIDFHLNVGEMREVTIYNEPLDEIAAPVGNLHLTKKAEITGALLSGAVFGIYDAMTQAKVSEITTGTDGTAVCELPEGSYYLLEQTAPTGYMLDPAQIPFYIAADNTVKVEVTNMAQTGGVLLTVLNTDGLALEGAVYGLYNVNDEKVAELTTGTDGKALNEVSSGVYYLLEEGLPEGYAVEDTKYSFYVSAGQTADILVMKQRCDSPVYEIPQTGEAFPWMNYGFAALCLCMAVIISVIAVLSRRRRS